MHPPPFFLTIALSLTASLTLATPLSHRQAPDLGLIHADTVLFIAKTIGDNPSPDTLPNINNWLATPIHSGAGQTLFVLSNTTHIDTHAAGFFRNASSPGTIGADTTLTAGFVTPSTPYSIVFNMVHRATDPNPGAAEGFVEMNIGPGTAGVDVLGGQLSVTYAYDIFYACPGLVVEGSSAIAVGVTDRYSEGLLGCWQIELFAQCAGKISKRNKAAFPNFVKAQCYKNATEAVLEL